MLSMPKTISKNFKVNKLMNASAVNNDTIVE